MASQEAFLSVWEFVVAHPYGTCSCIGLVALKRSLKKTTDILKILKDVANEAWNLLIAIRTGWIRYKRAVLAAENDFKLDEINTKHLFPAKNDFAAPAEPFGRNKNALTENMLGHSAKESTEQPTVQ